MSSTHFDDLLLFSKHVITKNFHFAAHLIGLDTIHQQAISGHEIDQMNEMQLEKLINNVR